MNPDGTPAATAPAAPPGGLAGVRLFDIAGTPVTLASVLTFAVILLVTLLVSFILQRAAGRALRLRGVTDAGSETMTRRLVHYTVLLIGVGIGLQTVGIDISAFFAAGALFAIGLGFAMQNITQNFVSGLILILERTIKPGDILEVDGSVVRVVKMGIRSTIVRSRDEEEKIVPNSLLVQSTVTNYTLRDSHLRLRVKVGVSYGSDMAHVRRVLEEAARDVAWRIRERDPIVLLTDFGDSSVNFEVSVWTDDPWGAAILRSSLHETIWWALKRSSVTIAYPQLDLHLDPPVVRATRGEP